MHGMVRGAVLFLAAGLLLMGGEMPVLVETAPNYTPLTGAERFEHLTHETILRPSYYLAVLAGGGLGQFTNSPPEWGQGVEGYARRAASTFGLLSVQATVWEASAATLRYEPRYIHSGGRGLGRRLGHAVLWTFVTWDSNRHLRPNIPILAGAYAGGMLQTYWYPDRYTPLHDGVRYGSQQVMIAVGNNILHEFTPDIRRLFHLK